MLKVRWIDQKTNNWVLQEAGEKRSLVQSKRKRKHQWLGHVLRHNGLLKVAIEGKLDGKRGPGRLRLGMISEMGNYNKLKEDVVDRERWRQIIKRTFIPWKALLTRSTPVAKPIGFEINSKLNKTLQSYTKFYWNQLHLQRKYHYRYIVTITKSTEVTNKFVLGEHISTTHVMRRRSQTKSYNPTLHNCPPCACNTESSNASRYTASPTQDDAQHFPIPT